MQNNKSARRKRQAQKDYWDVMGKRHEALRTCNARPYGSRQTATDRFLIVASRRENTCVLPLQSAQLTASRLPFSAPVLGSRLGRCFAARGVHRTPATRSVLQKALPFEISAGDPHPINGDASRGLIWDNHSKSTGVKIRHTCLRGESA